ncbi:hypothetical protein HDU76_012363 [Blyttiomyces sp. JEL0837]|nr:hypothetical protein HDU76_012363 [Blyttiomyces sp. JEL0837]
MTLIRVIMRTFGKVGMWKEFDRIMKAALDTWPKCRDLIGLQKRREELRSFQQKKEEEEEEQVMKKRNKDKEDIVKKRNKGKKRAH